MRLQRFVSTKLVLLPAVMVAAGIASVLLVSAQSGRPKPPCGDIRSTACHPSGPVVVKRTAQTIEGDMKIVGKFCIQDGSKLRCCPAAAGEYDLCGGGTGGGALVKEKGFMGTPTAWCAANGNCYPVAYVKSVVADTVSETGFAMRINFHWNGVPIDGYNHTGGDNESIQSFTFAKPYASSPGITFTAGVNPVGGGAGYFWEAIPQ